MFSRRLVEAGDLPLSWVQQMSGDQARAELVASLDTTWDTFKKLCKFELKAIHPVAAILNLLPSSWEARIVKVVDADHGVICIQPRQSGVDMSGNLGLAVTKMFCIFHLDDVYGVAGDKYRTGPDTSIAALLQCPVDLSARCIVSEGGQSIASLYHTAASQSLLAQTAASPVSCPILQAVCVYLKQGDTAAPVTLFSPRPTRLRAVPESVHTDEPGTCFYLSYLLPAQMDVKALNFFSATNSAKLQREVNNGLAMAHFKSSKRTHHGDRAEQQTYLDSMARLDTWGARRMVYGGYQSLHNPGHAVYSASLPPVISSVSVRVQMLYQQGFDIKEGLVKFDVAVAAGPRISHYAFFDMSSYKFALKSETRVKDLASIIPVYGGPDLKAHLLLANRNSPVSYVCTALWNSNIWTRDPEPDHFHKVTPGTSPPQMDPLFMEKYENIVSKILSQQPSVSPAASLRSVLPSPIPATPAPVLKWADDELLRNKVGKVTNIIDGNYGIAVVRMKTPGHGRARAIVLFDTCDVWVGQQTAQQLDMTLGQVMVEGDHVKLRAILVPESENRKNIRYLATSLVAGKSRRAVSSIKLPELEQLDNIDQIHPSKINNFYTVVSAVCHNLPGDGEEECRGVSTDEDEAELVPDTSRPPPPVREVRASSVTTANTAAVSLDAYEGEREKRKLAKANECLQQRRKLGYDKAAREKMLMELKVKNQLLWRCRECNITCGVAGMEKHVTSKMHWDKVLDNFKLLVDSEQPPINRSTGANMTAVEGDGGTYTGCSHYRRKCKLVAPCCDGVYSCRFCHDDAVPGHTVDRRKVVEVVCGICDRRQGVAASCEVAECGTVFGSAYFCGTCKLFDDEDKGQFHCDGCGICRVGGRDKFQHCDTCGLCLPRDKQHKCIQDTSHNNCPVCMEDIHNSRDGAHIPPCSHLLHLTCYQDMLAQGLYACPTCGLAMQDMSRYWRNMDAEVAATPMPREYADLYRVILCRDCNKRTTALFHIVGMKCGEAGCGSYNTTLDAGPLLRRTAEAEYEAVSEQELAALSNVSIDIDTGNNSDTDSDIGSSDSDGDDGWETTEEVDGDAGHDDH